MLFVQGTRDALAEPELLRPIVAALGAAPGGAATLHEIEGADHGFSLPRRLGDPSRVMSEIADVIAAWLDRLPPPPA
jgi:pimeloyl-ACP methyl ester carboxylesterase